MLYIPLSGGLRGKPFAQHCSCPTVLRCSVGLTMAAFLGTIFVWEKWLPQSHRGQAPALNRQGGNVRVAAPYHVEFLFKNEYASYTGRSGRTSLCSRRSAGRGFFQLQKQTCQKLWPLRALGFEARLLLPSSTFQKIKISLPSPPAADNVMIFHLEASSSKLRSDSFQKLRMLRNRLSLKSSLHSESTDFHKTDV